MARAAAILAVSLIVAPRPDHHHHRPNPKARIARIEPYVGWTADEGTSRYAIPAAIVECESRGDINENTHPYSSSGLYQIQLTTWAAYGGHVFAAFPYLATKLQQSIIARRILAGQGLAAWTCAYITGVL